MGSVGRGARVALAAVALTAVAGCAHHARGGGHGGKHARVAPMAPARLATIGVNAYLWQASLDTIAFMPIASVEFERRRHRHRLVRQPGDADRADQGHRFHPRHRAPRRRGARLGQPPAA